MKNSFLVLLLVFTFTKCSFKKEPAPFAYDKSINEQRKKAGLWVIDSTFKYYHYKTTYRNVNKTYGSPTLKLRKNVGLDYKLKTPSYWAKRIYLDKETGELQAEDDTFRTGKFKPGIDVNLFEELTYRYAYKDYKHYNPYKYSEEFFPKGGYYI
ncbi:MAG: hypothetical protein JKY02_10870, partial [Flavobacteriaceae bacterium]|nr:hypothetical protein [Flavobacteriaceae bacterium]